MSSSHTSDDGRASRRSTIAAFTDVEGRAYVELAAQACELPHAMLSAGDTTLQSPFAWTGLNDTQAAALSAACLQVARGPATGLKLDLSAASRSDATTHHADPLIPAFYAGIPLRTAAGIVIGTLGVLTDEPGTWSARQHCVLQLLGERLVASASQRGELESTNRTDAGSLRSRNARGEKSSGRGRIFGDSPPHGSAMGQEAPEIWTASGGFAARAASAAQTPGDGSNGLLDELAMIASSAQDGIIGLDPEGVVTSWNPAATAIYGYTATEMIGNPITRIVPPAQLKDECRILQTALHSERVPPYEALRLGKGGREVSVQISCAPIRDRNGKIIGIVKFVRDITPLLKREQEAIRHARLYAALSRMGQIVGREPPREELLQEACTSLVDDGAFSLAWIGWHDPDSAKLRVAASAGRDAGRLSSLHFYVDERPEGQSISGRAFRNARVEVNNDMINNVSTTIWLEVLAATGLRSGAAVPIQAEGSIVGVLTVYSAHFDFFQPPEVSLLERFVDSISLGLESLSRRKVIREAQAQAERERRLTDAIIESTPGVLYVYDENRRFVRWSQSFERFSGLDSTRIPNLDLLGLIVPEDREHAKAAIDAVFARGKAQIEARMQDHEGRAHSFLFRARRVELDGNIYLVGMGIDISDRVEAEKAREASEKRYRNLFEHSPLGVMVIDATGACIDANPAAVALLRVPPEKLLGRQLSELVGPDNVASIAELLACIDMRGHCLRKWRLQRENLHDAILLADAARAPDDTIMVGLRDITDYKLQEQRIARLSRLRSMIGAIQSAMLRATERGELLREACRIAVEEGSFLRAWVVESDSETGQFVLSAATDVCNGEATLLGHRFDPEENKQRIGAQVLHSGQTMVLNNIGPESLFPVVNTCCPQPPKIGAAAALPLIVADRIDCALVLMSGESDFFDAEEIALLEWVTRDLCYALEHIDTAARLRHLTHVDPLTGLMNKHAFEEKLGVLEVLARARQMRLMVCTFDLERFRQVNDQYGRLSGDRSLQAVAARLQDTLGDATVLARVGGDTFAVAELSAVDDDCTSLREQVSAAFEVPFHVAPHEIALTVRIGSASYPDPIAPLTSALDLGYAQTALSVAKTQGQHFVHFSHAKHHDLASTLSRASQLREALELNQFVLHYQPKLDLISGEIIGAEALVRWQHPEHGLLPPIEFIELMERHHLISLLGDWVLHKVCAQQVAWRGSGVPIVPVAVNVAAAQLNQGDLTEKVRVALEQYGLEAEWLELELTESTVMTDMSHSTQTLARLRTLGVQLALDDFGTGYSSLSHLKYLPFGRIKIDRSFIREVTHNVEDAAIVLAIIGIARSLGLKTIAEGVETRAQLNFLAQHHCDEMQGFFFSPAVPEDVFASYLGERRQIAVPRAGPLVERSLLLVDDEPAIRNALTRLLRRDGYRIITAGSGAEALDLLALHPVQVIVSDQRMPGMSGTELLDKIKSLYPNTVRMILSGYTDLNAVTDAVNRGAVFRFLTKPWDDDDLRQQVREAFVHYHSRSAAKP